MGEKPEFAGRLVLEVNLDGIQTLSISRVWNLILQWGSSS